MHSTRSAEPSDDLLAELDLSREQWRECRGHLEEVSRTFSKPIGMLPGELSIAATCGYLLCRITDTIEDHPDLTYDERADLFERFLEVLEEDAPAERFTEPMAQLSGEGAYLRLASRMDRVMEVFTKLPSRVVETTVRWTGEMTRGMRIYVRRATGSDGPTTLETTADLERYCYFVAGTVGHMLTGLFVHHLETTDAETPADEQVLRANAERFGLGLQLVNILKDQTDDLERGWCYIPRTAAARVDLTPPELYDESNREAAHRAVDPLFDRASQHLDAALDYTLALPDDQPELRLACLLPLWMAVRTLVHARGNDAMFRRGAPVKISRDEVAAIVAECTEHACDDEVLRQRYRTLWEQSPAEAGSSPP